MRAISALGLAFALGCGGASADPEPTTPPPAETEAAAPTYEPPVTSGTILRAELTPVLDAGLGRFLQGVVTEPRLEDGDFVGFELVSLYPDDPRFARLDLRPGDVVTRVNGRSIERPEHAIAVWSSLRVASQLLVEYRHEGEARELRFEIVD
jgi:hypothetical protein